MPRIFKGSESTLRLLIHTCNQEGKISDLKIALYTSDPSMAVEFTDRYAIEGNIVSLTVPNYAFGTMEDGVINYVAQGMIDDDTFLTERQSNYFLKTPANYTPTPIPEEIVLGEFTTMIVENGVFEYTPTDVDAWNKATIEVNVPDLNGSYDEGFNVGYEQGKTDGVSEQKSKLESINITENGTYTKEDGYNFIEVNIADLNGSYDEGYTDGYENGLEEGVNNAGEIIATNARILNVTKNGAYLSKYSDPIMPDLVTGVFNDGTTFHNYAELNNKVFDTGAYIDINSKVEVWWKPNFNWNGDAYMCIIGGGNNGEFLIRRGYTEEFWFELGRRRIQFGNIENKWYHIEMSINGVFVNDEKVGDFENPEYFENLHLILNADPENGKNYYRNPNGFYGMVKIDDTILIPTADGFMNYNTNELLTVLKEGSYDYTYNPPTYGEGELYKTIKVNVIPKIKMADYDLKFAYSSIITIPEWADFTDITSMRNMFSDCGNLKTIPSIDTSKVTDMNSMFSNCGSLIEVPELNTDAVENITGIFNGCYSLVSIPAINGEKIRISTWDPIFGYGDLNNLTDFGGFINLKTSISNDYSLTKLPNLSYQSCINILNGLYDFAGNGETPSSDQGQLKVHPNFLDKVGDEIVIGTNKGWIITA